jgi:hypothetical protein
MAENKIAVTHKQITVGGRKLTVWKATFETQLNRFTLMEQAQKALNGKGDSQEGEGLEVVVRRGFTLSTYPSLLACTTGNVWTEEQCYKIENDDLEAWLTAARELNPSWFPTVTPETAEEMLQKKES